MNPSPEQTTAVILAGGFGTRIRHILGDLPKPMAPVLGRPFLEWVVRYLAAEGIRHVVISTGFRAEIIEQHFTACPLESLRVQCIPEVSPLGTAGGFCHAMRGSGEQAAAWLVLNGDSLALASLRPMWRALSAPSVTGAILGVAMPDTSRYGTIVQDASGELVRFDEKKPGAGVINAGVYLFTAAAVNAFPSQTPLSFENDVFPSFIRQKIRLKVCAMEAPFLDIGTPESLPLAEAFISANLERFGSR